MSRVRDAAEEAGRIAEDATQQLRALLGVVDKSRQPAVDAAKCADVIDKLRAELGSIAERFRALGNASGDDAVIE